MNKNLFDELKVGDTVYDSWYPERGYGEIIKVYKTTIHVDWGRGPGDLGKIYDKQHVNHFLRKV